MLAQTFGRLRADAANERAARFERVYDYAPEELWAAITEPEQIRGWLGEAELDLREGGSGTVQLDGTVRLRVRQLDPGRLVEYDWEFPGEPTSVLRRELEPHGDGTLLVLDHRRLAVDDAADYGAGWHTHLDWLEAHLAGREFEFWPRFDELAPTYAELAAAV